MIFAKGDNAIGCSKQKDFTQGLLYKAVFFLRWAEGGLNYCKFNKKYAYFLLIILKPF